MRKTTFGIVLLTLGLAACGSSDDKDSDGMPSTPGATGGTNGTATTGAATGGASGSTNAGGPANTTGGGGSGGSNSSTNIGIFPEEDGGNGQGPRDATVVNPTPAKVLCGSAECTIKDNFACCEQAADSGWMSSCVGESSCSNLGGGLIPSKSIARCDTKDDCGGLADQYCCFVRQGPPPSPFTAGTPFGRQCRTIADCNNNAAIPMGTGKFSCQQDSDCPNGLKCNAEAAGDTVGEGGRTGRPWVKVCG